MADEEMTHGEIARTLKRHDHLLAGAATKEALAEFKGEAREKFARIEKRLEADEGKRTAKTGNWIAAALVVVTLIGLIVTVLSQGGK